MTPTEATITYVEREISGEMRRFEEITVLDTVDLLQAEKKRRRDVLRETLKDVEADGDTRFSELQRFDDEPWGQDATGNPVPDNQAWLRFVNTRQGQLAILIFSLEKTYPGEGKAIIAKYREPMLELVAKLCGLTVGNPDPNPTAPAETKPPTGPGTRYGT